MERGDDAPGSKDWGGFSLVPCRVPCAWVLPGLDVLFRLQGAQHGTPVRTGPVRRAGTAAIQCHQHGATQQQCGRRSRGHLRAALVLLCSHSILAVTLNGQAGPLDLHCLSLKREELKEKEQSSRGSCILSISLRALAEGPKML